MSYPKQSFVEQKAFPTQQQLYPSTIQQPLPGEIHTTTPFAANVDNGFNTTNNTPFVVSRSRVNKGKQFWAAVVCGGFLFTTAIIVVTAIVHPVSPLSPWSVWGKDGPEHGESTPILKACVENMNLDSAVKSMGDLTTFKCLKFCDDRRFSTALTHNGQRCSCANFTKATGRPTGLKEVDDELCSTPCAGRAEEKCGSPEHESLYAIGPNLTVTHESWNFTIVPFHLTWGKSRDYCKSISSNGDLAIDMKGSLSLRSEILHKLKAAKHRMHWIGLTDSASEGSWLWNDDKYDDDEIYWQDGEPNSWEGQDEDCAAVLGLVDWRAYDVKCDEKYQGICQYPA